ncbi:hypothetical protein BDQ12DRAFT_728582 [Crucibulum laeve]|uniref:Helicase C-terminal domain-containing protein n=1 Tax=Crucibulum laeve TaxID=68775 RepID=A0A5C3LHH1_9AGAR|nr:hypothetical protein BDQ12DRAFT_728582 [Crucibulum laeve]
MAGLPPKFNAIEWDSQKSTKLDACAQMCQYLLSNDKTPDISFENGKPIFPPLPKVQDGDPKNWRILIYQEFPSFGPLLQGVLKHYNVDSLQIDGSINLVKHNHIVQAGLNLSIANTVILLDQPWSAQDERQIRGRAHRQPQKDVVKVYHLLAADSADIILSNMAQGKQDMLEAFVSKEKGEELIRLLSGKPVVDFEDDNEDLDADDKPVKPKQQRQRQKKKVVNQPAESTCGDATFLAPVAKAKKYKKKSTNDLLPVAPSTFHDTTQPQLPNPVPELEPPLPCLDQECSPHLQEELNNNNTISQTDVFTHPNAPSNMLGLTTLSEGYSAIAIESNASTMPDSSENIFCDTFDSCLDDQPASLSDKHSKTPLKSIALSGTNSMLKDSNPMYFSINDNTSGDDGSSSEQSPLPKRRKLDVNAFQSHSTIQGKHVASSKTCHIERVTDYVVRNKFSQERGMAPKLSTQDRIALNLEAETAKITISSQLPPPSSSSRRFPPHRQATQISVEDDDSLVLPPAGSMAPIRQVTKRNKTGGKK